MKQVWLISLIILLSMPYANSVFAQQNDNYNYTVYDTKYDITAKDDQAFVSLSLEVIILEDKWTEIKIVPIVLTPSVRKLPSNVFLSQDSHYHKLLFKKKGSYHLNVKIPLEIVSMKKIKKLTIPLIPAVFSKVQIAIPQTNVGIEVFPEAIWEKQEKKQQTLVTIVPALIGELVVTWGPREIIERPAPTILLNTVSSVRIEEGLLTISHHLKFNVSKQPLKSFKVILPEGSTILKIEGKNLDRWFHSKTSSGKSLLNIYLETPVYDDTYSLHLVLEQPQNIYQPFTISALKAVDLTYQSGSLLVFVPDGFTVNITKSGNMEQTDTPPDTMCRDQNVIAYRYQKLPARLEITLRRKSPKIYTRLETLNTFSPKFLLTKTQVFLTIKEIGIDSISMKIPPGFMVRSITGPMVKTYYSKEGLLEVVFQQRLLGKTWFSLEMEKSMAETDRVLFTSLCPEAVIQAESIMAIKLDNIEAQVEKINKTNQINPDQLSRWLKQASPSLGFRSLQKDWQVEVKVWPLKPVVIAETYEHLNVLEDRMVCDTYLKLSVKRAPLFAISLNIPKGLKPINISSKILKEWAFDEKLNTLKIRFLSGLKGESIVRLQLEKRVKPEDERLKILPLTISGAKQLVYWLAFSSVEDIVLTRASMKEIIEVSIKTLPPFLKTYQDLKLAFRSISPAWSLEVKKTKEPAKLSGVVCSALILREGQMKIINSIEYDIKKGGVNQLRINIPGEAVNVEIKGKDIKNLIQIGNTWEIKLGSKVRHHYTLLVNYEKSLDDPTKGEFIPLQLLNADLASGGIVIAPGHHRTEVMLSESKNARSVTEQEITFPLSILKQLTYPPTHFITYTTPPARAEEVKIALGIKTYELNPMLQTKVLACDLFSVTRPNGELVTYMYTVIENTGKQHLTVTIPEGTTLWGAYVDDKPVKPITKESGEILVPLIPEKEMTRQQTSVVLVYIKDLKNLGMTKKINLRMPTTDLKMENAIWHLFLPRDYYLSGGDTGSMKLVYHDPMITYPGLTNWAYAGFTSFIQKVWAGIPPVIKHIALYIFISILLLGGLIILIQIIRILITYLWLKRMVLRPLRFAGYLGLVGSGVILVWLGISMFIGSPMMMAKRAKRVSSELCPEGPVTLGVRKPGKSTADKPVDERFKAETTLSLSRTEKPYEGEKDAYDSTDAKNQLHTGLRELEEVQRKVIEKTGGYESADDEDVRYRARRRKALLDKKKRSEELAEEAGVRLPSADDPTSGIKGEKPGPTSRPVSAQPTKPPVPEPKLSPPSTVAQEPEINTILSSPSSSELFARTTRGLSRGALPIAVSMPLQRTFYYAFESPYLGGARGDISFYCLSTEIILFLQFVVCLIIGLVLFYLSRPDSKLSGLRSIIGVLALGFILSLISMQTTGITRQCLLTGSWFSFASGILLILVSAKYILRRGLR